MELVIQKYWLKMLTARQFTNVISLPQLIWINNVQLRIDIDTFLAIRFSKSPESYRARSRNKGFQNERYLSQLIPNSLAFDEGCKCHAQTVVTDATELLSFASWLIASWMYEGSRTNSLSQAFPGFNLECLYSHVWSQTPRRRGFTVTLEVQEGKGGY